MTTPNIQLAFSDFIQLGSLTVIFVSIGYGLVRGIGYFLERKARKLEEYFKSFDAVVAQLSSSSQSSQLAAAVLLRRYFSMRQMKKNANLRAGFVAVQDAGHGNVLATLGAPRYKEIIDGLFART